MLIREHFLAGNVLKYYCGFVGSRCTGLQKPVCATTLFNKFADFNVYRGLLEHHFAEYTEAVATVKLEFYFLLLENNAFYDFKPTATPQMLVSMLFLRSLVRVVTCCDFQLS